MARVNAGKRFERAFKASLDRAGYALRINDKCFLAPSGRLLSEQSEGDFWFFAEDGHSYLIECKATAARSLPFANIGEAQERALMRFDQVSQMTHGVLALNYYGSNLRGKNALYLVPVAAFEGFKERTDRKSLPERAAADIGIECERIKGGWGIPLGECPW